MSWISRFHNLFRQRQLDADLEEELNGHLDDAIAAGRSPEEARIALGNILLHRERSRDIKLLPRIQALGADCVFGWRQLRKHRVFSIAAVLSLAIAIGATSSAFRLLDAVLFRPLPVRAPEQLSYLGATYINREGRPDYRDDFDYPTYQTYRDLASDRADVMLIGVASRKDLSFSGAEELDRVTMQFVSGNVFPVLGVQPAAGRLLTPDDDRTPGGHPVAVISYDFWSRRFARSQDAIGQTFRFRNAVYQVAGVSSKGFNGTEPGALTDVYIPAMMNTEALDKPGWSWFRIWFRPRPGYGAADVLNPLQPAFRREHELRLQRFSRDTPREVVDADMKQKLITLPAAAGASDLQKQYRRSLLVIGILVTVVLLLTCANVASLLTAQSAGRARELALRVSIGAGRFRLLQMLLVESTMLATAASALGFLFSSWAPSLVVAMLRMPEDPVNLALPSGWREIAFAVALAGVTTLLFGLLPAVRASGVRPVAALKGGDDARARHGLLNILLGTQVAFCVLVLFVSGLFLATFQKLTTRPLGFSPDQVLTVEASFPTDLSPVAWTQVVDEIRQTPSIQAAAVASWPLLSGNGWTGGVRTAGHGLQARAPYFLAVSNGFFNAMQIAFLGGRDFRPDDRAPEVTNDGIATAGVGVVNTAFARFYFDDRDPVGRIVEIEGPKNRSTRMEVIGVVGDAVYRDLREPIRPAVYVPLAARSHGALIIRTAGNPSAIVPTLRKRIPEARPGLAVQTVQPQSNFVRWHLLRERVLAALSSFFAVIALVLAAIGLYGMINYSVVSQRREIGIRIALGARAEHIVRRVMAVAAVAMLAGSAVGLLAGAALGTVVRSLLYEVRVGDSRVLIMPVLVLLLTGVFAASRPLVRAVKLDPAETLRTE